MGPKLLNCCKLEHVGTKEYGNMTKQIQVLEDGRIPSESPRNWKIEGQKKKNHENRVSTFFLSLKWKVLWRKKDYGILSEKKMLRGRRSVA